MNESATFQLFHFWIYKVCPHYVSLVSSKDVDVITLWVKIFQDGANMTGMLEAVV